MLDEEPDAEADVDVDEDPVLAPGPEPTTDSALILFAFLGGLQYAAYVTAAADPPDPVETEPEPATVAELKFDDTSCAWELFDFELEDMGAEFGFEFDGNPAEEEVPTTPFDRRDIGVAGKRTGGILRIQRCIPNVQT